MALLENIAQNRERAADAENRLSLHWASERQRLHDGHPTDFARWIDTGIAED